MKRHSVYLIIFSLIFAFFGGLYLYAENFFIKNFIVYPYYGYIVILFFFIGLFIVLFRHISFLKNHTQKIISFIIFAPLVIFPIFRCFFTIPYTFCRVCPRQCPFGQVRNVAVPGVLLMNLDNRYWCYRYCPFGTFQDYLYMIKSKKVALPSIFSYAGYIVLAVFTTFYFVAITSKAVSGDFYHYFFKNSFSFSIPIFVVFLLIALVSVFVHRTFCNHICPIGTVSESILKVEKKIRK